MNKYNQVIVVEGIHDAQKIQSVYPGIECIVTNGSSISEETLHLIKETSLKREVILFLDPDYPGKQITNKILQTKGNYKIAFIDKKKAISNNQKKVGIEHAKKEDIIASIDRLFTVSNTNDTPIKVEDLMVYGLINTKNAKQKRYQLCEQLHIPPTNGKALLRMLNILKISRERIDEIIG